jgi:hypothetical protein
MSYGSQWVAGQEYQMFPECAAVIHTHRIPAAGKTHKAGVKGIDLGLPDNLVVSTAVEWTDHCDRMSDFQCAKMAFHGRSGDAQRRGRLGDLKLPAALAQHEFQHRVETIHVTEAEQALNVAGKKRVQPLTIEGGLL